MKKLVLMAFAAVAACNGAHPEAAAPATAAATVATATASKAASDALRADAKAAEVLPAMGSVLKGGDPNGQYALGEALPLHYVAASALAACGDHCAPDALVGEAVDRVYPVSLDGNVVGSITLHKVDGEWQLSAIGQGAASGKLAAARTELRRSVRADDDAFAIVQVIGPNVRFLAHREQATLKLTSLANREALAPRAAADVFAEIARVQ